MKAAIMQPYIFPYIGYFQLINAVDRFVIYDDVNYINRGWINRNNILVGGKPNLFSIPLAGASQNKKIFEIYIEDSGKWVGKFLKTIEMNYKKAPFFEPVFSLMQNVIFNSENTAISALNYSGITAICNYLNITTEIISDSVRFNNSNLKGQYRILDICKQLGADHYINPQGGMEIYSKKLFNDENIRLNFIVPSAVSYRQFQDEFQPWLSIIDVIMFNSKEATGNLLVQYELL